jgi:hypothetical protein
MPKKWPFWKSGGVKSMNSYSANVTVALVHHPVVDKNGQTIAAAVTSLDLHDIARACKTFGVEAFYVVTPLEDQQDLVRQIIVHWVTGVGAGYNPDRRSALGLIRLKSSLAEVMDECRDAVGRKPCMVVTSARMEKSDLTCPELKRMVREDRPVMLVFGTAWGLAPEVVREADFRLAPIAGAGDYNHLAVRSAVAIILDRIAGGRQPDGGSDMETYNNQDLK